MIRPAVEGSDLLLHELGRGSFGAVWEAVQESLSRPVALKHLHLVASPAQGTEPNDWEAAPNAAGDAAEPIW